MSWRDGFVAAQAEKDRRARELARRRKTYGTHGQSGRSVTVTLRHVPTGDTRTVTREHERGRRGALRDALAPFDPAEWEVLTISTHESILRDLRGRVVGEVARPEASMLNLIGLGAYYRQGSPPTYEGEHRV